MGARASKTRVEGKNTSETTATNQAKIDQDWQTLIDQLFAQLKGEQLLQDEGNEQDGGNKAVSREDLVAFALRKSMSQEEAESSAAAFLALVEKSTVSARDLELLVRAQLGRNVDGSVDAEALERLANIVSTDSAATPAHMKLLRQSSVQLARERKACQSCKKDHTQTETLFTLETVIPRDVIVEPTTTTTTPTGEGKQSQDDEGLPPTPQLVRQSSQEFAQKLFATRVCGHSFCVTCLEEALGAQLVANVPLSCPVCKSRVTLGDAYMFLNDKEFTQCTAQEWEASANVISQGGQGALCKTQGCNKQQSVKHSLRNIISILANDCMTTFRARVDELLGEIAHGSPSIDVGLTSPVSQWRNHPVSTTDKAEFYASLQTFVKAHTSETSTTPSSDTKTAVISSVGKDGKVVAKSGEWACEKCTVHNKKATYVCSVCNTPKKYEAGDLKWSCERCTLLQASSAQCSACQHPRPVVQFVKPEVTFSSTIDDTNTDAYFYPQKSLAIKRDVNMRVELPNSSTNQNKQHPFSVMLWVKLTEGNRFGALIARAAPPPANRRHGYSTQNYRNGDWEVMINAENRVTFERIHYFSNQASYGGRNRKVTPTKVNSIYASKTQLELNKWYHVAVTQEDGTASGLGRMYINGIEEANWEDREPVTATDCQVGIACYGQLIKRRSGYDDDYYDDYDSEGTDYDEEEDYLSGEDIPYHAKPVSPAISDLTKAPNAKQFTSLNGFRGELCDIVICSQALPPDDVLSVISKGTTESKLDCVVAHWKMDGFNEKVDRLSVVQELILRTVDTFSAKCACSGNSKENKVCVCCGDKAHLAAAQQVVGELKACIASRKRSSSSSRRNSVDKKHEQPEEDDANNQSNVEVCTHLRYVALASVLYTLRLAQEESFVVDKKQSANALSTKPHKKGGVGYGGASGIDKETQRAVLKSQKKKTLVFELTTELLVVLLQLLKNARADDGPEAREMAYSVHALLFKSKLVSFLGDLLRGGSIKEYTNSHDLFSSALDLCNLLGTDVGWMTLLRPTQKDAEDGHRSVVKALLPMREQLKMFSTVSTPPKDSTHNAKNAPNAPTAPPVNNSDKKEGKKQRVLRQSKADEEEASLISLAQKVEFVSGNLLAWSKPYVKRKKQMEKLRLASSSSSSSASAATTDTKNKDSKQQPQTAEEKQFAADCRDFLCGQQFSTADLLIGGKHIFAKNINANNSIDTARMLRIRKEMASLSRDLPPGIFVRFDNSRFDILRVMIVGADDTPYEKGCFLFDACLPQNYPNSPPLCKIITTGKGKFRFNANLYTNGKVCLSLLGTWAGPKWDPKISTLLQVFVSIQALIMCANPIANEPSWESKIGTIEAQDLDSRIQHATMLYAMTDHLVNPPFAFEDATRVHFYLERDAILQSLDAKVKEIETQRSRKNNSYSVYGGETKIDSPGKAAAAGLRKALAALKKPVLDVDSDTDSDSD